MVVSYFRVCTGVKVDKLFPQKLQLSIKAELENVTNLVPAADDFEYFFQVCQYHFILVKNSIT